MLSGWAWLPLGSSSQPAMTKPSSWFGVWRERSWSLFVLQLGSWTLNWQVLAKLDTCHNLTYCSKVSPCGRFPYFFNYKILGNGCSLLSYLSYFLFHIFKCEILRLTFIHTLIEQVCCYIWIHSWCESLGSEVFTQRRFRKGCQSIWLDRCGQCIYFHSKTVVQATGVASTASLSVQTVGKWRR